MIPEDRITPGMNVYRDGQNRAFVDRYMNGNAHTFFNALAGIWNRWNASTASVGQIGKNCVTLTRDVLSNQRTIEIKVG